MSEPVEEKVGQLEQELRVQAELYRALLELARRQAKEISREDIDSFMLLLEEKRKIIEKIGEIELSTGHLREFWESHKEEVGERTRTKLRSVVDEIRTLLEELLELESHSQSELGIAKGEIEEEIRQLNVGKTAMRSYRRAPDCEPRFMDESG